MDGDLLSIAKGSAVIFFGIVIERSLGLFGHLLLVRSLSPSGFGELSIAFSFVTIVSSFTLLGLPAGVTRMMSMREKNGSKTQIIHSGIFVSMVVSIVVVGCIYAYLPTVSSLVGEDSLSSLLPIFLLYLLILPISRISVASLRGFKQAPSAILADNIGGTALRIMLFSLFLLVGEPYLGGIIYWVATPIFVSMIAIYFLSDLIPIRKTISGLPRIEDTSDLVSFSWPLAFDAGFMMLMINLDIILISYYLESQFAGWYKSIQPLTQILIISLNAVGFMYMPVITEQFSKDKYNLMGKFYSISTKWIVFPIFPVFLVFVLYPDSIITILYSPEYLPASTAMVILFLGTFFRVLVGLNGDTIKAIGRTRVDLISSGLGVLVNVVLNLVLIPRFGIVGAAAATSIGFVVFNSFEVWIIYKSINAHPFSFDLVKPLIFTGSFAFLFSEFIYKDINIWSGIGVGILFFIVNVIGLLLTSSLDKDDLIFFDLIENATSQEFPAVKEFLKKYT